MLDYFWAIYLHSIATRASVHKAASTTIAITVATKRTIKYNRYGVVVVSIITVHEITTVRH